MKKKLLIPGVDDSKSIPEKKRENLYEKIINHPDIHYATGVVDAQEIDSINILQATLLAMKKAVEAMDIRPGYLLVDGLHTPKCDIDGSGVVKGDKHCYSIALASIIAKTLRDRIMREYHEMWPEYGFAKHKGYGTKAHVESLYELGPCPIHRKTFAPISSMIGV